MAEESLRVLHVFGRLMRGGAELRTIELAESFGGERVVSDFLVLTGQDGVLDERVRAVGGQVIKCPIDWRFPAALYRVLRARQYDVVHSHVHFFSGVVLAIARAAGTPGRVAHFRTAVVDDRPGTKWRRAQLWACRRLIDLNATDILAVGEGTMKAVWGHGWRTDPRCRVVYNGLPLERIRRAAVQAPVYPTIIHVGSLQPIKNQLRLVSMLGRCLRDIPDLRLLLVGREIGDYGVQVRRAAAEAGLADRVQLMGEVEDPMALIARANLMILPSLWEGLPGAALEACALGIPLLAADLPGTRELASYFPHVALMDLHDDHDAWAAAAVRLMREQPGHRCDAAECFARSPFALERARETHYEIWSRSRASA